MEITLELVRVIHHFSGRLHLCMLNDSHISCLEPYPLPLNLIQTLKNPRNNIQGIKQLMYKGTTKWGSIKFLTNSCTRQD
jgi:hypothetical protein